MGTSVWASPASEAIQALTTHGSYTREVRLSALGVVEPVALLKESASRDFYFPMPRSNVTDARIHFSGRTHKTEEGRTGVILSVNGIPQYTQTVAEGDAALAVDLSVAPRAQPDGFARLGVQWQTLTTVNYCQLERDTGNVLTISPDSRLVFRHGLSNLSVDEAWRLLPPQPVLLVGSTKLAQDAYDTAWRLGTALTRAGKAPRVAALPDVGSNVTLGEVSVPAALAGVPAFAGLRSGSGLKIEDAAQLAALMLSGGGAIRGDVLVVDAELRKRVGDAIAALSQQMSGDTQAQAALAAWGDQLLATAGADGAKGAAGVRTAALGGQPTLAVSTGGAGVVGALDSVWRQVLQGPTAQVQSAKTVDSQRQNTFSLASLGAGGGSIDVVAKGEWSGSFPLAAVLGGWARAQATRAECGGRALAIHHTADPVGVLERHHAGVDPVEGRGRAGIAHAASAIPRAGHAQRVAGGVPASAPVTQLRRDSPGLSGAGAADEPHRDGTGPGRCELRRSVAGHDGPRHAGGAATLSGRCGGLLAGRDPHGLCFGHVAGQCGADGGGW